MKAPARVEKETLRHPKFVILPEDRDLYLGWPTTVCNSRKCIHTCMYKHRSTRACAHTHTFLKSFKKQMHESQCRNTECHSSICVPWETHVSTPMDEAKEGS